MGACPKPEAEVSRQDKIRGVMEQLESRRRGNPDPARRIPQHPHAARKLSRPITAPVAAIPGIAGGDA